MNPDMRSQRASVWLDGIRRHLQDLKENAFEGASGSERDRRYLDAFELLTPIAMEVLQEINASFLAGTGEVSLRTPSADGAGGQIGSWLLTWPELSRARSRRTGDPLLPVTISAVFPPGFTHPHLVAGGPVDPRTTSVTAWPMQVISAADAEQQRPVLWAIATAELHDRIYQSSWRLIPNIT
jgi:hypothetical protein